MLVKFQLLAPSIGIAEDDGEDLINRFLDPLS